MMAINRYRAELIKDGIVNSIVTAKTRKQLRKTCLKLHGENELINWRVMDSITFKKLTSFK